VITAAYILLILSLPLLIYRIAKGPNWADRIITSDLLMIYLVAGLLCLQMESSWGWDRDVIWLVLGLGVVSILGASLLIEVEDDR